MFSTFGRAVSGLAATVNALVCGLHPCGEPRRRARCFGSAAGPQRRGWGRTGSTSPTRSRGPGRDTHTTHLRYAILFLCNATRLDRSCVQRARGEQAPRVAASPPKPNGGRAAALPGLALLNLLSCVYKAAMALALWGLAGPAVRRHLARAISTAASQPSQPATPSLHDIAIKSLDEMRSSSVYKSERVLLTPQGTRVGASRGGVDVSPRVVCMRARGTKSFVAHTRVLCHREHVHRMSFRCSSAFCSPSVSVAKSWLVKPPG